MSLVLDCSVTLAWAFPDEHTDASRLLFRRVRQSGALVPPHWMIEVANALRMGERRKRITPDDVAAFIRLLAELPIEFDGDSSWETTEEAQRLSRAHGLTVYDAVYLELAMRRGLPLATTDAELLKAAGAVGVASR